MQDLTASYHDSLLASNKIITVSKPESNVRSNKRSTDYLRWRSDVSYFLRKENMHHEADLFESCSDPSCAFHMKPDDEPGRDAVGVCACSEDPNHFAKSIVPSCDLRICPDCAHRASARLLSLYMPVFESLAIEESVNNLVHLVLTTPFDLRDQDIAEKRKKTNAALPVMFDSLLGKDWRQSCGFLVADEFGEHGHKLHYHILAYMPWVDKQDITDAWMLATGGECEINYIRRIVPDGIEPDQQEQTITSAVAETLKYATKFWKVRKDGTVSYIRPDLVPKLLRVLKGTRRIRSYGVLRGCIEQTKPACPECGSGLVMMSVIEWEIFQATGWNLDEYRTIMRGTVDLILANKILTHPPPDLRPEKPIQAFLPNFGTTGRYMPENSN